MVHTVIPYPTTLLPTGPNTFSIHVNPHANPQVCMAGGFTQLVVYRYTGPRLPPGKVPPDADDAELASRLASFDW